MHRRSLALTGTAFILSSAAVVLTGPPARRGAAAQESSDDVASDLPAPLAGWVADWQVQPLLAEPIAAAYTADAVYEELASGVVRTGRPEILAYLTEFFDAFQEPRAEVTAAFAAGDQGAAEWTFYGQYRGQLPGFPPGSGQSITFRGASMLDLRDGMIAHETQYFDVYGLLIQLGLMPEPASTPGP